MVSQPFRASARNRIARAPVRQFLRGPLNLALSTPRVLALVTLLPLLLPVNVRSQADDVKVLFERLRADNPVVSGRAAIELASKCDSTAAKPQCDKISRELEGALAGKACLHAGSDWCEAIRQTAWALAHCAKATGRLSPKLFEMLKNPAYAGARPAVENSIAAGVLRAEAGGYDPVRHVIEAFKSEPNYVREVPIIFAAVVHQVLVPEAGAPNPPSVGTWLSKLANKDIYPRKNEQDPLLAQVRLALASTIADKLQDPTMSSQVTKLLCEQCAKGSGELSAETKQLVEVHSCRLKLIEGLTARIEAGGDTKAEQEFLLALLPTAESKGEQKVESAAKLRAGFVALLLQHGKIPETPSAGKSPDEQLKEFQEFRGRVLNAVLNVAPHEDQFEIIRSAVQKAVSQNETTLLKTLWDQKGQKATDPLWKEAVQRGFADALLYEDLDDAKIMGALSFLETHTAVVLAEGTGRNNLLERLVRFLRSGPKEELKQASLAVLVKVQEGLPVEPDFYYGLDRNMLDALIAAIGDPILTESKEFWQLEKYTRERIQKSKMTPKVPGPKLWLLADSLLAAWERQHHTSSKGFVELPFLMLNTPWIKYNAWLHMLYPGAELEGKKVDGLEAWQKWWRINKYTVY